LFGGFERVLKLDDGIAVVSINSPAARAFWSIDTDELLDPL